MKNISLTLNGILLIAVAVLYYLHFKKPANEISSMTSPTITSSWSGPLPPIVFVNTDSLLNNYTYFKTKKAEFEARREKLHNELTAESDKLQSDYADFQQKAGVMTEMERQKAGEEFLARQNKLEKKQQDMQDKFDDEQLKFSEQL